MVEYEAEGWNIRRGSRISDRVCSTPLRSSYLYMVRYEYKSKFYLLKFLIFFTGYSSYISTYCNLCCVQNGENSFDPLTTTRRYTVAHFRRFLTVLKYSPIGVKCSPTIAPRTLYTVKKNNIENFQNFYCFESFDRHK